jgi:hypothetical protein
MTVSFTRILAMKLVTLLFWARILNGPSAREFCTVCVYGTGAGSIISATVEEVVFFFIKCLITRFFLLKLSYLQAMRKAQFISLALVRWFLQQPLFSSAGPGLHRSLELLADYNVVLRGL